MDTLVQGEALMHPQAVAVDASFDRAGVLTRIDGDLSLLGDLVALYRSESPRLIAELRRSLEASDARGVEMVAHTLRGSVWSLGGILAAQIAVELEARARERKLDGLGEDVTALEAEMGKLEGALVRLGGGHFA
jgi:HPt (histidine-containing phosphotransfer) domain-containing protein